MQWSNFCEEQFITINIWQCVSLYSNVDVMQKLMWKLNKSIVKDMLPTQPVDFRMEPWWVVCFVNLTTDEYRVKFGNASFLNLCSFLLSNRCVKLEFLGP